jgi:hypothetical protein
LSETLQRTNDVLGRVTLKTDHIYVCNSQSYTKRSFCLLRNIQKDTIPDSLQPSANIFATITLVSTSDVMRLKTHVNRCSYLGCQPCNGTAYRNDIMFTQEVHITSHKWTENEATKTKFKKKSYGSK